MRRRRFLDLALASVAVGGAWPALARAECAPPRDEVRWLTTNVHPGSDVYLWLGQPPGAPAPTELEATIGDSVGRLPVAWVVPGVARLRIPGTATGTIRVAVPSREGVVGDRFDIAVAAGTPLRRVVAPPASCHLERRLRGGRYVSTTLHFAAAPTSVRHVLARWEAFGWTMLLGTNATAATLYSVSRCGADPVHATPPSTGTLVEVAFLDDEGNVSSFSPVVMPGLSPRPKAARP